MTSEHKENPIAIIITFILLIVALILMYDYYYPCHNNIPYTDAIKIKLGMTIKEVEAITGEPNQSLWYGEFEVRSYLYDEIDGDERIMGIGFKDSLAISIQSK